MGNEEIKQKPVKEKTIVLEELADWIKNNYPEEFALQIQFEYEEDENGKG